MDLFGFNFIKATDVHMAEHFVSRYKRHKEPLTDDDSLLTDEDMNEVWTNFEESKIYKKIIKSEKFKKACEKRDEYFVSVQKNWNSYEEVISKFLKEDMRFDGSPEKLTVIITNHGGFCLPEEEIIEWGHWRAEEDPAYDAVYLTHEYLHYYEYSLSENLGLKTGNVTHAIIENITDVTLSKKLGGTPENYNCHKFTKVAHKLIDADFQKYLNKKGKFKDMQLSDFFVYCSEKYHKKEEKLSAEQEK